MNWPFAAWNSGASRNYSGRLASMDCRAPRRLLRRKPTASSRALAQAQLRRRKGSGLVSRRVWSATFRGPCKGHLVVSKHRYWQFKAGYDPTDPDAPFGAYHHYWLVSPEGKTIRDLGEDLSAALADLFTDSTDAEGLPHLDA